MVLQGIKFTPFGIALGLVSHLLLDLFKFCSLVCQLELFLFVDLLFERDQISHHINPGSKDNTRRTFCPKTDMQLLPKPTCAVVGIDHRQA